ncbi:putative MFS-type transporter EfpA [Baekduia alba]|uniref:MFS transporter n=1 Tax=Baekduia alba TaxID=2997333 RepID=UPI00233FB7E6|nr:MFS transporter [Baekduia alba]WCB93063.1 putative MFS-type transporter EfpA [Baekduia alba]
MNHGTTDADRAGGVATLAPGTTPSRAVLALLVVAQFMVVLDISIVNVALPAIDASLHFAAGDLQWVVTAYVLCSGGLLLVGGRAADLLGRRRIFLTGLLLFTAASLASGLAPSPAALVGARAVQGTGAAMLTPAALSIITTTYSGPDLAKALALWGGVASAGVAVGVIVGGMLTTWLSWHWVFLVNVPVGLVAAALTLRIVPAGAAPARGGGLDLPGAVSAVLGLAALVYGISGTATHAWGSAHTVVLLVAAAALLATFTLIERSARHPLVPPVTWRNGPLVAGAGLMLAATGIMAGTFFLNSVYLQDVLGWSALRSGLAFLPFVVAIGAGVHLTSHAVAHMGSRSVVVAGLLLAAVGSLLLASAPDHAHYAPDLLPGFCVLGLGMGLAFPALSITALSRVDHASAGLGSGLLSTGHEVGAALGVAVLSTVAVGAGGGLAVGYGDALTAAAVAAGAFAAVAALVVPVVRPAPGARVGMH